MTSLSHLAGIATRGLRGAALLAAVAAVAAVTPHLRRRMGAEVADVLPAHHEDDLFGDVGGVVGHALEVLGDVDDAHGLGHLAGVLAHELGHRADDAAVELVHRVVAHEHLLGPGRPRPARRRRARRAASPAPARPWS